MAGCLFHYGTKRADGKLTEEEWLAQHADACEKIAVQEHEEITVNGIRYDSWRCTDTQNDQPMVEWYAEQQAMHWVKGCSLCSAAQPMRGKHTKPLSKAF